MKQLELFDWKPPRKKAAKPKGAQEWKIVSVRETAPDPLPSCGQPIEAVDYWRNHVATASVFYPEVECFVVLLLNIRHRIRGHHLVSIGALNETVAHPREVFRAAVIGGAWGIVLMHNHPSGDPTPSSADIRTTERLRKVGDVLQIEVLDHIIVAGEKHLSLREAGLL